MVAEVIDGLAIARAVREEVKDEHNRLRVAVGRPAGLAVVLVGDDPASAIYVRNKQKACEDLGFRSELCHLPASSTQQEVIAAVNRLNGDDGIDAILVQSPLPPAIDEFAVTLAVEPAKDVDGFHPVNVGRLVIGVDGFVPCTPRGVQQLLLRSGVRVEGTHTVIVGRSTIVGKPLAALLMRKQPGANATVTVCHSRTTDLAAHTRQADILVAAIGSPQRITGEMVKPGAVVIDVGINRVEDPTTKRGYRLVGDVNFESVREVASKITPVPGGVGPMTIAMLMVNTVKAFKQRTGVQSGSSRR